MDGIHSHTSRAGKVKGGSGMPPGHRLANGQAGESDGSSPVPGENCAGVLGEFKPLAVTEADEFDALIATNLPPTETTGEHKVACPPLKFYQYIIY
ncbi:hypothetical protein [Rhizobium leguminosarum]|uniref:hypothetical protein n=1 Tax=Rhizobium leguminosarum TaxID=384 RepID=UPI001FEF6B68|nr:hypothetical protein [Rhizobium leguminosarum]